ncbi:MAG: hypothetical protein LBD52_05280 [Prevotellaceae bacterium]|jgi:hypothetical protein|nr:hypothetical protein [Prevotellaceae bacterium]
MNYYTPLIRQPKQWAVFLLLPIVNSRLPHHYLKDMEAQSTENRIKITYMLFGEERE